MRAPMPVHPLRRHRLALLPLAVLAAALGAAGCGAGAMEAKGGAAPADAAPIDAAPLTDADSALAELSRAEGEIGSLLGPAPVAQATATAPAEPAQPPAPAPAAPQAEATAADTGAARLAGTPASDACSIACRALASMDRAAAHLCGLSGESDPTCTSARERVKSAAERVSARCPCPRSERQSLPR